MTRARIRREVRKRREDREAKDRKPRRVWAASLLLSPLELSEGPEPCKHVLGEPVSGGFPLRQSRVSEPAKHAGDSCTDAGTLQ